MVLIAAPKLFIEPGTKGPVSELSSVSDLRIVTNFAASASSVTNIVLFSQMNGSETFEPGDELPVRNEHSDVDESRTPLFGVLDYVFL